MPKLPKPKNKHDFSQGNLTFGDYQRRLKENPEDPEIQEVNKKFQETIKLASLGIQAQFNSPFIEAMKSFNLMGSQTVKAVKDSQTKVFEELNERMKAALEGPKITIDSFPPSPQHRLNTIMSKLDYIESLIEPKTSAKELAFGGIDIVSRIRNRGKKYRIPKKVAKLFLNSPTVSNFEIIKRIEPTIIGNNYKRKKIPRRITTLLRKSQVTTIK